MKKSGVEMLLDELIVQKMNFRYGVLLTFDDAAKIVAKLVEEQMARKPITEEEYVAKAVKKSQDAVANPKKFWGGKCDGHGRVELKSGDVVELKAGDIVKLFFSTKIDSIHCPSHLTRYRNKHNKTHSEFVPGRMSRKKWFQFYNSLSLMLTVLHVQDFECVVQHDSFTTNAIYAGGVFRHAMWIPMWFLTGECWK